MAIIIIRYVYEYAKMPKKLFVHAKYLKKTKEFE